MADLTVPDISEFQGTPNLTGLAAVIVRAHNGWRADYKFAANRAEAHRAGCRAVGLYQYLPATVDPAGAAHSLLATVGALHAGEWLICDLEEGAGSQLARWQAWAAIARTVSPVVWLYAGLNFASVHNLAPDWVAAYQTSEPATPHKLWQNTDTYPWPWGRSDGSIFHGTVDQLLALITPGAPPASQPAPLPIKIGDNVQHLPVSDGRTGGVTLDAAGWTCVGVTLPAGMTKDNVVNIEMDGASPYDGGPVDPWQCPTACVDFGTGPSNNIRVVVHGGPGKFYTGRVYFA